MFFLYVLLNMTVSMVKGFFDKNMRMKKESYYACLTQLTLDTYGKLPTPLAEKIYKNKDVIPLLKASGNLSESPYIHDDSNCQEAHESGFQVKVRPQTLCR